MENNGIWAEQWTIASFMVGPSQLLRLKSCGDIFQELANNHANYRKVGYEHMQAEGKFWVLNRQTIDVRQMPAWGATVHAHSWISMMKGPFSLRHFALSDGAKKLYATASYLWTSIDINKKRPVAFPDLEFPVIEEPPFPVPEAIKIKFDHDVEKEVLIDVQPHHLDIIGHANNATYLEWLENEYYDHLEYPCTLRANYTGESHLGDQVKLLHLRTEDGTDAMRILNPSGKEIFKAKMEYT